MKHNAMLAMVLVSLGGVTARAGEEVSVGGVAFATHTEQQFGDKMVKLALTGAGVREKFLFEIYAIASYRPESGPIKSVQQLAMADCPKALHLVMLRGVNGKDMADAFVEAIRLNYPAPALKTETDQLAAMMRQKNTRRGDHVWLRHVPGVGLECDFAGQLFLIKNIELARAVWNIYFGQKNINDKLKHSLSSQL